MVRGRRLPTFCDRLARSDGDPPTESPRICSGWQASIVPYERSVELAVADGVSVRFSQSGRPIERYSVVLVLVVDGIDQTVRVYDNHLGTHHMHRYTREGGKQSPETVHQGTTNEALAAAIAHLKANWPTIVQSWES
jgi:hypothetical protein